MIKEKVQFMMDFSSVFNRIHFLLELKNASGDDRIIMLEYITPGQMACIGEIARRIYHHTFPLLIRDLAYFEGRSLVLRVLFSLRVSFRGKVATLVRGGAGGTQRVNNSLFSNMVMWHIKSMG